MTDLATLSIKVDSSDVPRASRELDSLSTAGEFASKAIATLGAGFAALKVIEVTKETALLAARFETMGVVMRVAGLNAGYSAVQMQALESTLQKTGISMLESRNALTSLATAHIDLGKAAQLARAAQDLAVVGGINSSEAMARVVQGIKSGETEVLRTIGLNVQFEDSYKKLAQSLGKNVKDLTDQEKTQARVNVVLKQAAAYQGIYEASMTTAGKQLKSMERYLEDLKVKAGEVFGPALTGLVSSSTTGIQRLSAAISRASQDGSLGKLADTLGALAGSGIGAIGGTLSFIVNNLELLEKALIAVAIASAYAWGPRGLAMLSNIAGPLLSNLVGVVSAVQNFTASATLASTASAAWGGTLAFLSNPITAIIAGVTALTGAFLLYDTIVHGSMADVEAQSKRMEEHNQRQKGWLSLREDALRVEKQLAALRSDGGKEGPATRENSIQALVKKALPDGGSAEDMASARLYAEKYIDASEALKKYQKSMQDKADADRKAADAAKEMREALASENKTIYDQWVLLTMGERAQYFNSIRSQTFSNGERYSEEQIQSLMIQWDANKALKDQIQLEKDLKAAREAAAKEQERRDKALMEEGMRVSDQYLTPEARRAKDIEHLNLLLGAGGLSVDAYNRKMADLNPITGPALEGLANSFDSAATSLGNWAAGMDNASLRFKDMVKSMGADLARLYAQQGFKSLFGFIAGGLSNWIFGGGGMSYDHSVPFSNDLGVGWGGALAGGGATEAGKYYLVGEQGPELFSPGRSGTITPNSALGGQTINSTVIVNIDSNGNANAQTQTSGTGPDLGRLIKSAVIATIQEEMRPRGLLNQGGR
ncbi:phage tail tape measure protein [Mesoterricola sediminis]|uniref:Phage tail tape measure protein n=1 Tax=Mesoterricola sediminis TaxID=2927980 RepID=A0AA48GXN9_9BACT|nr:hypothetical protein [Mesoterricola sediminis]BDU76305.1 hypothetical protein METESE_12630 [Mesoterricola sediminis]